MDALYIHIPFCDKKCFYCDFWTFINMGHEIDRYTDYIIKESRNVQANAITDAINVAVV